MKKILLSLWAVLNLVLWTGCSNDEGPQPSLELANPDAEFVLGADRNAMLAVSFTSTSDWQASTNVSWAVPSPQRGTAGAATLNLLASTKNDTGNNRQGVLTIKAGELTLTVKFTQSVMPVITTGQDVYPVPAAGGAFTLDYQTNLTGPFTLLTADGNSVDWVQTAPESRTMQNGELTLQVAKNPYDNERSAQLILQGTDENGATVSSNTFTLTQAARSVGISQSMADDKQVYQLQTHSEGNGVPLVLMGDGFLDTDISSGYYEQAMQQAMENLFTEEPYRSLRDLFDVWMVTAVSRNNAFTSGYSTAFSSQVDSLK